MDGSERIGLALTAPGEARLPGQIGMVIAVSGFRLSCLLFGGDEGGYATAQIGALIKVPMANATAYGFVASLGFERAAAQAPAGIAEIDLLGEQTSRDGTPSFARGISIYPTLGAPVFATTPDDIALIYAKPNTWTLAIGTLHQDEGRPAFLLSQEFLSKHSAILGTTGSGKSCALTLMLRTLLTAHPNGHVVLLDPHGEYAPAFPDLAERITPDGLQLPYWLFSFEEACEVLCSSDPTARSREIPILKEAIIQAKQDYLCDDAAKLALLTVDTPVPYRINRLEKRIAEAMGKLDRPDSALPYIRLLATIEALRKDRRYHFMFEGLALRDGMGDILSRILRIPVEGKPITIIDISAVPSEIVNVVVSLLCRLIFDFALYSEREEAIPILVVCDEAHRYIPRDASDGFAPTIRSISRIAKEGRKYGVSLCLVTQRPAELSETILSQCSTIFALRMNNEKDRSFVRAMLPDDAAGLMAVLPTLRQREAVAVGEGVAHPMRIRFAELPPEFRPRGEAANFPQAWEDDRKGHDFVAEIIERWRRQ
ncbi:MAG: ATP-binding protein [Stellaceae bacterium]